MAPPPRNLSERTSVDRPVIPLLLGFGSVLAVALPLRLAGVDVDGLEWPAAAVALAAAYGWARFFARDPERGAPAGDVFVAPVDGVVVHSDEATLSLRTPLFAVRTLRMPFAGRVERVVQRESGCEVVLAGRAGEVTVHSRAPRGGSVLCELEPGAACEAGTRFGRIPAGTRTEVRLAGRPAGGWNVSRGDRVTAGVSALAAAADLEPGDPA